MNEIVVSLLEQVPNSGGTHGKILKSRRNPKAPSLFQYEAML